MVSVSPAMTSTRNRRLPHKIRSRRNSGIVVNARAHATDAAIGARIPAIGSWNQPNLFRINQICHVNDEKIIGGFYVRRVSTDYLVRYRRSAGGGWQHYGFRPHATGSNGALK